MTDISTHMRNTAAMLATAATLLTGCQRKTEAVAPANDTNLAQRALPAAPLALDGDFGPRCHKRRAMITQIANLTSHFPHIKEDSGSNDTAIGPRTLRLLTESRAEFRRYFEADFAIIALSHNEAVDSSPRR